MTGSRADGPRRRDEITEDTSLAIVRRADQNLSGFCETNHLGCAVALLLLPFAPLSGGAI
jgi:hypothetical protein